MRYKPLTIHRVEDDAALRAKVDEALSVYDAYMKDRGGQEGGANGAAGNEEAPREEVAEPTAA